MTEITEKLIYETIAAFDYPEGEYTFRIQTGGHINGTLKVEPDHGRRCFLLQKINTDVFSHPEELSQNIILVTEHLRKKIEEDGGDPLRETLTPVYTKNRKAFYKDAEGNYWRSYLYIDGTDCYEGTGDPSLFYQCGKAFGEFQKRLADLDANILYETIPGFHNTANRYRDFLGSIEKDIAGRAIAVQDEIAFLTERSRYAQLYSDIIKDGRMPVRVVHNDTKLTNILFDTVTEKPVCVIDLDTVMPGLLIYDFGDAIRFGANSAAEDEPDISKVHFLPKMYEAYKKGFLDGCGSNITESEKQMLFTGAKLITFEQALRFLTDYLNGDVYYHTDREDHNLCRARVQIKLLNGMEEYERKEND